MVFKFSWKCLFKLLIFHVVLAIVVCCKHGLKCATLLAECADLCMAIASIGHIATAHPMARALRHVGLARWRHYRSYHCLFCRFLQAEYCCDGLLDHCQRLICLINLAVVGTTFLLPSGQTPSERIESWNCCLICCCLCIGAETLFRNLRRVLALQDWLLLQRKLFNGILV